MSIKEAWGYEADLGNRDPNNLNDHLKVGLLLYYYIKQNFKLLCNFDAIKSIM